MLQRDRTATSRIARMLRELESPDAVQDRGADVARPAINRGGHPRKRTIQQWSKAAAVLVAAGFLAAIAWQTRAVEMSEGAVTTPGAGAVGHVPLQVTATS